MHATQNSPRLYPHRERGAVIIAVALFLFLMLGFLAVGVEVGRWYLVRAELSKSVDAGALEGARNITNPYADPKAIARDFAYANFSNSYLGTAGSGVGAVGFDVTSPTSTQILVTGHTTAENIFAQVLNVGPVAVASAGAAVKRPTQIMLVLDRSGSMTGQPIADLKVAAKGFLSYFAPTQDKDQVGLISFSTAVRLDRALGYNFVTPMTTAINGMSAGGWTNSEDAILQVSRPGGLPDQSGIPADAQAFQQIVFFSDGVPTAFRGNFERGGKIYDAVLAISDCPGTVQSGMMDPVTGNNLGVTALPTGDGVSNVKCGASPTAPSVYWMAFNTYPPPGYTPTSGCIPNATLNTHMCNMIHAMALDNAAALKKRGVVVYPIGLGNGVDKTFMANLASSPDKFYYAPTSADLQAIFQQVAQQIQLRLVQ